MQRTDKPFVMGYGITNTTWDDDKKWAYLDLTDPNVNPAKQNEILPQGQFYNFKPTKGMIYTQSILIDTDATFNPNGQSTNSWFTSRGHNEQKGYFKKLSETTYRFWSTYTWQLEDIALRAFDWFYLYKVLGFRNSGTYLAFYKPKLETSDQPSEWSLAPEDLGWSMATLVPTQEQRYLWKFEYIYYSDGSAEITQPTNISIAGTNGQTSHVHFAFADNATGGGFSLTTPKAYMGWYADFNETASNDPTKYKWGKWKGDQGAPGGKGDDGKTSYLHLAFASSADGKTGFSFTESGQQYQGYYTDFTQSSSTDPTKYTWMDRRAGVEVGSKNLLRKTAVNTKNLKLFGTIDTTVSVVEKDGHQVYKLVVSGSSNAGAYFIGNSDYYNLAKDRNYTFSFWVLTNKDKNFSMNSLGHIQAVNTNSDKVGNDSLHQHTQPVYSTNIIKANTWTKVWLTFKPISNSYFLPHFWYLKAGDEIYIYDMMLNEGTIPLSHSLAPEDTQEQIDSKADQALTQQQLNALAEQNSIVKAEMEAKASIDTVNQWITAYQNYVNANDEAKAESERNLQEASARILQLKTDVGTLRQQWDFIDTYMTVQNEGLIIGKSDGSAYAKFANDRISLFSGSSEVMYISQGVLRIENGIFTKTIQIGRFRFETHPADQDMLVLRYLGG
ncbi:hypothetical protein [uncultured Streptococcus sp.]|uniref:hypothetical protein n=1 Tax=uncultured Streptococcus sp. TaxID=83427 RepID=UPI002597FADF|nr:hypothetical protein [uncultured Streptococcus sp.]